MNYCPSCGTTLVASSAFCSGCGRRLTDAQPPTVETPPPKKGHATQLLILVGVVLFALLFLANSDRFSDSPTLTMAKYERIESGMSYGQVIGILGETGTEISRSDIGGYTTVIYMWKEPTGANMNAMFQKNKLINKAQFGLK